MIESNFAWEFHLEILLYSLIISFIFSLIMIRRGREYFVFLSILISITSAGIIGGILTGGSRDSAVSSIMPIFVGIGGSFLILFKFKSHMQALAYSVLVFVFANSIFLGASLGSNARHKFDLSNESFERRSRLILTQKKLNTLCESLKMEECKF